MRSSCTGRQPFGRLPPIKKPGGVDHEEKCKIVESIEKGIYQHDIYSWQVMKDRIIRVENLTNSSEVIYKTVKDWLSSTSPKQRQIFFDCIFDVFYSTSAKTFGEISNSLVKNMPILFKSYKEISDDDRKIITSMIRDFIKAYTSNLKETEKKKIDADKIKLLN